MTAKVHLHKLHMQLCHIGYNHTHSLLKVDLKVQIVMAVLSSTSLTIELLHEVAQAEEQKDKS